MDNPERYDFALFGSDPEYLAAAAEGLPGIERFFGEKLRLAEETGDERYIFEAVYYSLKSFQSPDNRTHYLETARRLLSLCPPNLQMPVYVAEQLFEFYDEPGLALDLIRHGYNAVTDAASAYENLGYLIEAKKLELAIEASVDPWSEETGRALYAAAMASAQPGEMNRHLLEAMKTITNRPTESWLEAWMQKSLLRSMWSRLAGEQELSGVDRSEALAEIASLHRRVPDIPLPELPGSTKD